MFDETISRVEYTASNERLLVSVVYYVVKCYEIEIKQKMLGWLILGHFALLKSTEER